MLATTKMTPTCQLAFAIKFSISSLILVIAALLIHHRIDARETLGREVSRFQHTHHQTFSRTTEPAINQLGDSVSGELVFADRGSIHIGLVFERPLDLALA